ncbi:MerR family transcriptional regulator [Nocardiopsis sp. MG754419]|uniref:helix-turn-helix domain-containing protein n=1 Tax=Nocardiopsis sp. MG754419 TaxID=2259865 RepID=UPI001BA91772|nr:MerR family transcriptional regulator [Nocardiopsis sp. MG754419]MBR8743735.1 MerR family transcriptional regulator [Nocardiopsis sp. MG754419]
MLSSELAALAGVTVRTLRHYHQIGLLPEPPRSSGGYRHYDVGHLVRLLRITRLTALGVPLSALPAVLDDPDAADALLDELDHRAAAEIERLTARRAVIAALRRSGAPPDLPPELSSWRSDPEEEMPADMVRYEHEQLILIGHLLEQGGLTGFSALFDTADGPMTAPAPLTARFYTLEPDASDDEVSALVDALVAYMEPVVARMADTPPLDSRASALLDELNEQTLRPVQHRVLRLVQQRLALADPP